jgi:amidophosphoribosyltransferase
LIVGYIKNMKLVKDIGLAKDLDRIYNVKSLRGSHGMTHLRIATSSQVTPYNAHPFSTTEMLDLAVVHNGEITNYPRLRQKLEKKGNKFHTTCDSEVIPVYIADKLRDGFSLEEANKNFIEEADGLFTYIVGTPDSMAVVRDRFGLRKAIIGRNPGNSYPPFYAMATDSSALNAVGANFDVGYLQPGEVRVFHRG